MMLAPWQRHRCRSFFYQAANHAARFQPKEPRGSRTRIAPTERSCQIIPATSQHDSHSSHAPSDACPTAATTTTTTTTLRPIPTHILGAGSIGLLWAASLRLTFPSYPVRLLLREHHIDKVEHMKTGKQQPHVTVCYQRVLEATARSNSHKYSHSSPATKRLSPPLWVLVPCELIASGSTASDTDRDKGSDQAPKPPPPKQSPIHTLVLTTKAFQALEAVQSIQHRLSSQSRIVLLLNGALAVQDELQQYFHTNAWSFIPQFCCAWTTHGAYQPPPASPDNADAKAASSLFRVVHAGASGETRVENWPELAKWWNRAGLRCESVPSSVELHRQLWLKLAANCVINPLTARYDCTNGDLLDFLRRDDTLDSENDLIRGLTEELVQVARGRDQHEGKHVDLTVDETLRFIHQVLRDTTDNYSSMVQDVRSHRRTEVDYLNGYVVRQGQAMGVDCHLHRQLWDEVLSRGTDLP